MPKFEVFDPCGVYPLQLFDDEKKALQYREKMEKQSGRILRMEKIFDNGDRTRVYGVDEEFQPVTLSVKVGDIITSQKGILMEHPMTGKQYNVKRLTIIKGTSGRCGFIADEKEEYCCGT
jgi:hypothetical protein